MFQRSTVLLKFFTDIRLMDTVYRFVVHQCPDGLGYNATKRSFYNLYGPVANNSRITSLPAMSHQSR